MPRQSAAISVSDSGERTFRPRQSAETTWPWRTVVGLVMLSSLITWSPRAKAQIPEAKRFPDRQSLALVPTGFYPLGGAIRHDGGVFLISAKQPEPTDPRQPVVSPGQPVFTPGMASAGEFELGLDLFATPLPAETAPPAGSSFEAVARGATISTAATDIGGLLSQANSIRTVEVQRRSPVALDPNIRGFKQGQIYTQANGVYWMAARPDLDTMLSKLDPGMIQEVIVIPGPYSVRYGPGLSFLDVVTTPTPRYEDGFETHLRSYANMRANGGQFYGRETVFGGDRDWGFRLSYGHRQGSDYEAGNSQEIPASYTNRDVWGEIGYDLGPEQRLELAYQRLDQVDTEYAGQFFDMDYLGAYGFNLRYLDEDPAAFWSRLCADGWYNRTRFFGDTDLKRNPSFPVIQRVETALDTLLGQAVGSSRIRGASQGDLVSSGARTAITFGETDSRRLTVGGDFRYLEQNIEEQVSIDANQATLGDEQTINTNQPRSWMQDGGGFAELALPMTAAWIASAGVRGDLIQTTAREEEIRLGTALPNRGANLRQHDALYAFYVNNEVALDEHWTLRGGMGHGQRPPTLIERYADGLFLGIIQSGFTRVIGDPQLDKERNWQLDVGMEGEFDQWRGKATFFHAWVVDYITLKDDVVQVPPDQLVDARRLFYTNTELATLTGFELASEYDWNRFLTPFATMRYVDGRDRILDAPLPAIPPLDSTVGVRWHDAQQGRTWGFEISCRIVDAQERLGTIRLLSTAATVIEERTPGFNVWQVRSYYNASENLHFVAGVENLFNHNYQEHLDLRLISSQALFAPTRVLSPGITPYIGVDWIF